MAPSSWAFPLRPLVSRGPRGRPHRRAGRFPDGIRRGLEASLRPLPGPRAQRALRGRAWRATRFFGARFLTAAFGKRPPSRHLVRAASSLRASVPPAPRSRVIRLVVGVSPLPSGPAGGTAGEAPPGAPGPGHGPRRRPVARREAWLGGRPLAAPQSGLPGRHEDGRGGTNAARGSVGCVAPGTKVRVFVGTGLSLKLSCSLTLLEKLGAGCFDNRKADASWS